jgi:hypothetical protein
MKVLFFPPLILSIIFLPLVSGSLGANGQSVPYSTSFESPVYSLGPVDGQDGWSGDGTIQNASPFIRSGTQSLRVTDNRRVRRVFPDTPKGPLFIDGYYHEIAVANLPDATELGDGTSFVLFHETEGILAFDGDGNGGGTWVSSGIQVATDTLQRVTIGQDYDLKEWVLYIDEEPVGYQGETPYKFGFKNDSIVLFSAVDLDASDAGAGYLDDFSVSFNWPEFLLQQTPSDTLLFSFIQDWFLDEDQVGNEIGFTWDLAPGEDGAKKVDVLDLLGLLGNFILE